MKTRCGRCNRKAQIQMGESVAVVIVVIILLVIGIVFWHKISVSDIDEVVTQTRELSVIEISNTVSELQELKCYDSGADKVKCLDYYKIKAMSNLSKDPLIYGYYNNYFKSSKITVQIVYPHSENITIYDSKSSKSTKTLLIPIPVNVRNYVDKVTYYGIIVVEGYYVEK